MERNRCWYALRQTEDGPAHELVWGAPLPLETEWGGLDTFIYQDEYSYWHVCDPHCGMAYSLHPNPTREFAVASAVDCCVKATRERGLAVLRDMRDKYPCKPSAARKHRKADCVNAPNY
jgi:hypothetical protein